jgi:hypothetical protein
VIEPRPLIFDEEWSDIGFTGAPLTESVLRAFVGRCQECGSPAENQDAGSVLSNPLVVEGTLYGDTFCLGCHDEDRATGPVFVLPPIPDDDWPEGVEW